MSNPYEASVAQNPGYMPPPTPDRPQAPMVIGILNILYGIWNLCGVGAGVFGLFMISAIKNNPAMNQAPNPGMEAMENPFYFAWSILTMVVTFVMVVMMIASGVGLIQYRMWGRNWSVIWSGVLLAQTVLGLIVAAIFIWLPMFSQMNAQQGNPQATAGLVGGVIGGLCGVVIGLAYPSVVLYFTQRESFKAALS